MQFQVFTIPAFAPPEAMGSLNVFLRTHRVLNVQQKLIEDGRNSFWSFCVEYLDGQMTSEVRQIGKVDYREVLPPEQFERFSRLRALRKELADKEAVPPYAVFTNEQLAAMARLEAPSLGAIEEIEGVGAAKMKKYGVLFLAALQTGTSAPPAPAGEAPALKNVPEARQIAPQNPADRTRS